jgi:DNA-binding response OmpR family regulator
MTPTVRTLVPTDGVAGLAEGKNWEGAPTLPDSIPNVGLRMARILIVEDDLGIGDKLSRALVNDGYDVEWVRDGASALAAVDAMPADLVLLDLGLPDRDGVEVCRAIDEEHAAIPVIVLTARSDEIDVVIGLDAGASDYIVKPFRLAELLARVRAQLRQRADREAARLTIGALHIDPAGREVQVHNDRVVLRPREFDLLLALARHVGQVVTRESLMSEVWDEHWFGSTKTLDVHVAALRRKLGDLPGPGSRITTVRGVGYRLELR